MERLLGADRKTGSFAFVWFPGRVDAPPFSPPMIHAASVTLNRDLFLFLSPTSCLLAFMAAACRSSFLFGAIFHEAARR